MWLVSILFFATIVCASALEAHRHRHSKGHREFDLDRLMNRLDTRVPTTTRATLAATPAAPEDPGNSLWEGDSDHDSDDHTLASTTLSPLDPRLWDAILKNKRDKAKARDDLEEEDDQDDLEERGGEDEEGFVEQEEQADSFGRPWMPRSSEPSLTSWKYENLGTFKAVQNSFLTYRKRPPSAGYNNAKNQVQANFHHRRVWKDIQCKVPKPRVINVLDDYPSPHIVYFPSCTLLHRCGDDTGCCNSPNRCRMKNQTLVELHFHTTNTFTAAKDVQVLTFHNHTDCECMEEATMPRDGFSMEYNMGRGQDKNHCKCPTQFTERWLANGSCTCDCFDKQRDCLKYKKGKDYFNHEDRVCIEVGTCKQPVCDFGAYIRSSGRCPRKHEKFRTWSRFH